MLNARGASNGLVFTLSSAALAKGSADPGGHVDHGRYGGHGGHNGRGTSNSKSSSPFRGALLLRDSLLTRLSRAEAIKDKRIVLIYSGKFSPETKFST